MIRYITGMVCFGMLLLSLNYCSKIDVETDLIIQQDYLQKGLTPMDIKCSKLNESNGPQLAACILYLNNKTCEFE